jgi:chlorophyll synthase
VCLLAHEVVSLDNLALLMTLGAMCWLAFAFNDYCDAPFDAHDASKARRNFFVQQCVPTWMLWGGFGAALAAIGIGFARFGWRGLLLFALSAVATWAYSALPLRLKARPGFDLIMHAAFVQTFPYLACLILIDGSWTPLDVILLAALALSSVAAQLEQQARDFALDSRMERNFTIVVGRCAAVWLLRSVSVVFAALMVAALFGGLIPLFLLPFGLIALPVIIHRFTRRADQPRSQRLILITLLLAALYVGSIWGAALLVVNRG